jgi:MoaA/NifB/PqqE/SkfB family radical SAM enzyme/glycosyltransferase involved in cell wall biosynthesis
MFEAFIREGFDKSHLSDVKDLSPVFDKETPLRTYALDSPLSDLLPEIRKGETSFILFADEIVSSSHSELQRIVEFLNSDHSIIGITLFSDALKEVYGFRNKRPILRGLTKKPATIEVIPSWFTVLNRRYLEENGLLESEYQSLEFFLFEVSERLAKTYQKIILLDSMHLNIDSRLWTRDLLRLNSSRLASDYDLYSQRHNGKRPRVDIPYQFRIEVSGKYVSVPEDDQYISGSNNSSGPTFSVICPAYKSLFFEDMIKSVLGQNWEKWELIVMIDGPSEEEKEKLTSILKKNPDPRIQFHCQENMGTGPTRRRLAQMAEGDFIVTIDDDDMLDPDALATFARAIGDNPDMTVFRGGAQFVGLVDLYLPPRQRIIINRMSSDLFEATQPFAIDRRVLEDLGGFEGDKSFGEAGEDSDLFMKIDRAGHRTCLIDSPLYFRRISTSNQTLSFKPEECMNHIHSLIKRHCPSDWTFSDIRFQKDGEFINASISYHHDRSDQKMVTVTRFFDYQTLGEGSDVMIDLEITSLCNSVCSFCPRDSIQRNNEFISMDLIDILAEQISQEKGMRQVVLCGIGEPTLHPDLETIVRKLHEAGARVCMTTNASLMNIDKFERLADAGMTEFNVSLNAVTAETHRRIMKMLNFGRIRDNLFAILDIKKKTFPDIDVNVSFVLCNENGHEVVDFVEQWRDSGASKIWIHPVNSRAGLIGEDITDIDISPIQSMYASDDMVVVDVFRHIPDSGTVCRIVNSLDFISVDGDMLLCALDYRKSTLIGNLKDMTLRQLHLTKFLKQRQGEINSMCHKCDFHPKGKTNV